MKIKPEVYAKTLIKSADGNLKEIARNFWYALQKNKQYKDLPRILGIIDEEYARENNQILAKVYSEKPLDEKTITDIKSRLSLRASAKQSDSKGFVLKNIVKPGITGIIVKVDDKIIDMTIEDKVGRLKKKLSSTN